MAAALWGGSFVILKDALDVLPPSWLLGIRFVLSGMLMTVVLWRRLSSRLDRSHVYAGIALGVSGGLGYLIQNLGLVDTTPGHNAFLTATYCVMVPFLHWVVARVRPTAANVIAAGLALAGVGMLSLGGAEPFALRWGDWMTIVGAFWFAVQIEVMVAVAKGRDVLTMTVVEFYVMGLYAWPMVWWRNHSRRSRRSEVWTSGCRWVTSSFSRHASAPSSRTWVRRMCLLRRRRCSSRSRASSASPSAYSSTESSSRCSSRWASPWSLALSCSASSPRRRCEGRGFLGCMTKRRIAQ